MVNEFGSNGGYEDIIEFIAAPETSLQDVQTALEFTANVTRLYHKSFIDSYFDRLADTVKHKLLNQTKEQMRVLKLVYIEEIIKKLWDSNGIMPRKYTFAE